MYKAKISDENDFIDLVNTMTDMCGLDRGSLSGRSREQKYQLPRSVVTNVARIGYGIHHSVMSKILNRDRTSIYHYKKCHSSNYMGWKEYRELFNSLLDRCLDTKNSTELPFNGPIDMTKYLIKNGAIFSKNPNMNIVIHTDAFTIDIATSYKDFSHNIEVCNDALGKYKFRLDVQIIE